MTKRRTVLKGSTVLLLALATGCASSPSSTNSPASNVASLGGAGLISNNASGLISNNAGGLISNNAGGLISNNAGGLISNNAGGLISNNAGGLISNNAGGLISNNAGGLTGTVRGPAAGLISNNAGGLISNNAGGLVSNNAGGLISNNAGGLISNNAGGLISNNAGGFHTLAVEGASDDLTEAVPNAKVAVFNERGEMISFAWSTTDDNGNYVFSRLKASGPIVFVKAVYMREGKQVVLVSTAPAPRKPGVINVTVSPATSIVAKKLGEMIRRRAVSVASVHAESVDKITRQVGLVMTPKAVVAAAILPADTAASTFDNMMKESPVLAAAVNTTSSNEGIPAVVAVTPPDTAAPPPTTDAPPAPIAAPDAPVDTGNAAPPPAGDSGTTTTATAPANNGGTGTGTTAAPSTAPSSAGTASTAPGSSPSPTASGSPAPAPTATATPVSPNDINIKATIFTLGSVSSVARVDMATGSSNFLTALRTGTAAGALSSLTSKLTFNEDPTNLAKSVAYDGSTPYYLIDNTIVGNGQTVTISGMGAGDTADLAVKGGFAYVSSTTLNYIAKVDLSTGASTAFAGTPSNIGSYADGQGAGAAFNYPSGLTFSGSTLYVADSYNRRIRAIAPDGTVTTFAGASLGNLDGVGSAASFQSPSDITVDNAGNLYVTDENGQTIRKIAPDATVTTIAGNRTAATVDGTGMNASLFFPHSLAWGKVGGTEVLVVSQSNHTIRLVSGW